MGCVSQGVVLTPLLTPSGGHQNKYSWQVGGIYAIGMFFLVLYFFICQNTLKYLKSEEYADKKYYHFGKEKVLQEKNEK